MRTIIFLLMFVVGGCTNPFVQYYQDRTGGRDLTKLPSVILPTGEPQMFQSANPAADHQRMLENNYNLVGISSFNGSNVNVSGALRQAKAVHAEIVLIASRHTGTHFGVLPLTLPDTQTSTTNLSGSSFGTGGFAGFSGTAQTTTYATQTAYIPYSIEKFDYLATYWIKMRPPAFGVRVTELTSEMRQKIGSNKGVYVLAVVRGSPAWSADLFKGDIITKISNGEMLDAASFYKAIAENLGKSVTVEFLRNGQRMVKEIGIKPVGVFN